MDTDFQACEMKNFDEKFLDVLCDKSQILCKPSSSPSPEEEYQSCSDYFESFEKFIIGINDKSTIESNISSSICGKIFKAREPVYICRDCATDDTCVLCRICFIKSEHTKHNYEMHTSLGGGYCDCGDEEAWKSFSHCNLHGDSLKSSADSTEEIVYHLEDIPIDVKINFLAISKSIFKYFKNFVMRPLCKLNLEKRSEELKMEQEFASKHLSSMKSKELSLVLYNNEFHNFDQVITLFKRCLQCTPERAMSYANIVDRDGRCVALTSTDQKDIEAKKNEISGKSKSQTMMELLCRIHHPLILSLQNLLIHILRWLYEYIDKYPKLRLLLCSYLFSENDMQIGETSFEKSTLIQDIFENHIEMWKSARNVCTNFVMTTIFKETYFKKLFVVQIAQNYKMILHHYSIDDHNNEDSLISLNCQLFTVISFAKYLLESHNFLNDLMKLIYNKLIEYSKPLRHPNIENRVILQFKKEEIDVNKKFDPFERHMRALSDLKFLLKSLTSAYRVHKNAEETQVSSCNSEAIWPDNAVDNFIKYFQTFGNFLSIIQDTDTIERVIEHHVEHDPNWKTGVVMMYDSVNCITLTAKLIVSNRLCWDRAFEILRQFFKTRIVDLEYKYCKTFNLFSYSTKVIENEWPSRYISVVKPLHRFMAALLVDEKYRNLLNVTESDCLLDQTLQMLVFCSQQSGNMWIRNGSVPYILTQQIKCLALAPEMFDRDIQLLQLMALCVPPESFILKCVHKFDLKGYLVGDTCIPSDKKAVLQRAEDFLHSLIISLFYRHRIGVGKDVTKESIYAHTILHTLCVKSMSHSKLMKKLSASLQKYPKGKLMNIIDKVADQTLSSQVVIFNAKKSLILSDFDRYVPYYSLQDRNEAELSIKNFLKKEGLSMTIHPPIPINLTDGCAQLLDYISNPCYVELLNKFLYICITKTNGDQWTDTILDMVLYLIGSSLLEDIKNLELNLLDCIQFANIYSSNFLMLYQKKPLEKQRPLFVDMCIKPSSKVDIVGNLELLCDKISCDQHLELIKWIIRKSNEIKIIKNSGNVSTSVEAMETDNDDLENVQILNQMKIAKADAAKKRRELLMSKMWSMQKKFINENSELLTEKKDQHPVPCVEDHVDSNVTVHKKLDFTCILCQEKNTEENNRPIVLIAGAWRSAVLAKHPFISTLPPHAQSPNSLEYNSTSSEANIEHNEALSFWASFGEEPSAHEIDRATLRSIISMLDHVEETFITTCGHVMHYDCKASYMKEMVKLKQNFARTKGVLYPRIYNRCPLCKCVCNIDIPIIKSEILNKVSNLIPSMSFQNWVEILSQWMPNFDSKTKKLEVSVSWWSKLGSHFNILMRHATPMKTSDSSASDEDLVSCLASRTALAIKLHPSKLTKETYKHFESIRSSFSESSSQELIELDYAVMYTISVWDRIMLKHNTSILTDIPERHANGLRYLINAVCKSHQQFSNKEEVNRACQSFFMLLHQMLFDCTNLSFHKAWLDLYKYQIPLFILEVDFTFVLGSLLFMRYSLANSSQSDLNSRENEFFNKENYNFYIVKFIYQFVFVQILLSLKNDNIDNADVTLKQLKDHDSLMWSDENVNEIFSIRESLVRQVSDNVKMSDLSPNEVAVGFYKSLLSFLRIAVFMLHELGSVDIPAHFTDIDGEFIELFRLLKLDLIPFSNYNYPSWISNQLKLISDLKLTEPKTFWSTPLPHVMPVNPPKLIDLPNEFTEVITMGLDQGCSLSPQASGTVSEISLCLICGVTVCLTGYCCRRIDESSGFTISGAQIHARQCHEGYALFLNTRNSKVVVLFYQARWQIYLDPIYFDKFGESDIDLKRGNPLFLNLEAYGKLERNWLNHSIGCVINDGFQSNDFFV